MTEENQRPEALGEEAGLKYDSAERHQDLAAGLESVADREAVLIPGITTFHGGRYAAANRLTAPGN